MALFGKLCVFCLKRFKKEETVWNDGLICICGSCMEEITRLAAPRIFDTTKNVSIVIPSVEYSGIAREAMHQYKFNGQKRFGKALAHIVKERIERAEELRDFDAIVTVPVSVKRLRERGYNQSEAFARAVSEALGIEVHNEYLTKTVDTKRQSELGMSERLTNLKGAYSASPEVKDKHIIIVDDIYTTGSTMEECARTLKAAGASEVAGVTFAAVLRKRNT